MANKPLKIEDDLWNTFGELAPAPQNLGHRKGQAGGRAGVIRQFIRWYTGEPGVACPRRPAAAAARAKQQPAATG